MSWDQDQSLVLQHYVLCFNGSDSHNICEFVIFFSTIDSSSHVLTQHQLERRIVNMWSKYIFIWYFSHELQSCDRNPIHRWKHFMSKLAVQAASALLVWRGDWPPDSHTRASQTENWLQTLSSALICKCAHIGSLHSDLNRQCSEVSEKEFFWVLHIMVDFMNIPFFKTAPQAFVMVKTGPRTSTE